MKVIRFFFLLACTILFIWFCSRSMTLGDARVPAPGPFFSPFTGFWQNAESVQTNPQEQTLEIPGLRGEVTIVYDGRMVPHIFASSMHDALMAQGYVTARHRLWQMDLATRDIAGRLSEILGPGLLERDQSRRRQGMLMAAQREVEAFLGSRETQEYMEAYVSGVNAWIDQLEPAEYPLEFKLLGYEPERWTLLKSALFHKNMANTLCRKEKDIAYTNALTLFGRDTFDLLYPEVNPSQSPIVNGFVPAPKDTLSGPAPLPADLGFFAPIPFMEEHPEGIGSNNWAVAGSKTQSGYPILANDPHLNLTLPAIWYELQIQTPQVNAYGASMPGVPGIIIGFNEKVAWGVTNVGHDLADLYTIEWANEEKTAYMLDGEPREVEIVEELIYVSGEDDPVVLPVKYTIWGPVVAESSDKDGQGLALRWIAHDAPPVGELNTFLKLNGALNTQDYLDALTNYTVPPQNFVFAASDGDIAIRVNGKFPIRNLDEARFVRPGNMSANKWKGFIPFEDMPMMYNPESGFVGSANQRSTDGAYPYPYFGFFDDYRGRYLNRRLSEMENITVDDMKALQLDNYTILAEDALPVLLGLLDSASLTPDQRNVVEELSGWNYRFDADQTAPVVFFEWFERVVSRTWDECREVADTRPIPKPDEWVTIRFLKEFPELRFFDILETQERETAEDIVTQSFHAVYEELEAALREGTQWGTYVERQIPHLARIPAFSYRNMVTGGFRESLNSIKPSNGPSWRMIVELGPEPTAWGVYPGGQSGNPGSHHYQQMVDTWVRGDYYPLKLMSDKNDHPESVLLTLQVSPSAE
jgi:penicillin amidase